MFRECRLTDAGKRCFEKKRSSATAETARVTIGSVIAADRLNPNRNPEYDLCKYYFINSFQYVEFCTGCTPNELKCFKSRLDKPIIMS